jgi:hypothetical protein
MRILWDDDCNLIIWECKGKGGDYHREHGERREHREGGGWVGFWVNRISDGVILKFGV